MIGFAPYAHSEPAFPPQTADASCAGEGMTAMPTTAAGADCAGEAEAAALSGADMAVLAVSAAPRDRAVPPSAAQHTLPKLGRVTVSHGREATPRPHPSESPVLDSKTANPDVDNDLTTKSCNKKTNPTSPVEEFSTGIQVPRGHR